MLLTAATNVKLVDSFCIHSGFSLAPLTPLFLLSDSKFFENDLVAIRVPPGLSSDDEDNDDGSKSSSQERPSRLCVVRQDLTVVPLCRHEDDVETDLFIDPRTAENQFWQESVSDEDVANAYGEGFYGQRPVPSLGGGPGYGAPADEIWTIDEDLLLKLEEDGVELPVLDVGIAHGEKARGGAF